MSTQLRAALRDVRTVLRAEPARMLDERLDPDRGCSVRVTLKVQVGAGCELAREVIVRLGDLTDRDGRIEVPLGWGVVGAERLFPAFDGLLFADDDGSNSRLGLEGAYRIPLSVVGAVGDGVVGHRLARASLSTFLEGAARRIDDEVDRHRRSSPPSATQYVIDLREIGSEHYIG